MNTLSIVASFGALVWIFQDGNLSALLGFQPLGFVETTQPVILFCVLFGLSMDYEVFLLSRMKEVWDRTGDNAEAVARGLERSGRIVTSAALIVVVVAGSFAFADIVLIKALGLGMAHRGRPRRDGRPGAARAGHDAPARPLELVDAGRASSASWPSGCRRPRPRSRRRSDEPARRRGVGGRRLRSSLAIAAVAVRGAARAAARSWPTRPRPAPSRRAATATARRRAGSAARRPAARRRRRTTG